MQISKRELIDLVRDSFLEGYHEASGLDYAASVEDAKGEWRYSSILDDLREVLKR